MTAVHLYVTFYCTELMPDQPVSEEEQEDISTEFVIPGLPSLSKKLDIGPSEATGQSMLERDLALYDQKAKDYLSKIVGEARLSERSELQVSDHLRLAVPATSVPSERLFSISGILSEYRRSRISPDNLEKRVILKANPYL